VSSLLERLAAVQAEGGRAVLFTVLEGERAGSKLLVVEGSGTMGDGPETLAALADEVLRGGRNRLLDLDGSRVFAEWYGPPPRLLVYGAVDTAEALCAAARLLGWRTMVADARAKFATQARIPSADELIVAWPDEAFARVEPDHQTAVVVLTHDDKFDEPALAAALASEAFYIGALGSRRNQERRRERLLEAGFSEVELDRISGPCGLDVGAETLEETAISILGEILAVRVGRGGGRLQDSPRRIHADVEAPSR
jgi:xanthine dehydrogenase accessory factor